MFGELRKWLLVKRGGRWFLDPPRFRSDEVRSWHRSFTEAHAAYLDAVTCEKRTPFANYTNPRCTRSKGHEGACSFPSKTEGHMPLRVNPK